MRNFLNLTEGLVLEGATIYPARRTEENGEIHIGWPDEFVRRVKIVCRDCEGKGCVYCQGSGKETETIYDFPEFSAGYAAIRVAAELMGLPSEESYWVAHEDLPEVRRRLIRVKNGDLSDFAQEATVERERRVDRSGGIPRITSGPTMIGFGMSESQIGVLIDRLLGIIDWAQKHDCGISWA